MGWGRLFKTWAEIDALELAQKQRGNKLLLFSQGRTVPYEMEQGEFHFPMNGNVYPPSMACSILYLIEASFGAEKRFGSKGAYFSLEDKAIFQGVGRDRTLRIGL